MINVSITYRDDDTLFGPLENIGFCRWEHFKAHIERLIKWEVPFQLVDVSGTDEMTGLTRNQSRIIACPLDNCHEHCGKTVVINRSFNQTNEDFLAIINKKATK